MVKTPNVKSDYDIVFKYKIRPDRELSTQPVCSASNQKYTNSPNYTAAVSAAKTETERNKEGDESLL